MPIVVITSGLILAAGGILIWIKGYKAAAAIISIGGISISTHQIITAFFWPNFDIYSQAGKASTSSVEKMEKFTQIMGVWLNLNLPLVAIGVALLALKLLPYNNSLKARRAKSARVLVRRYASKYNGGTENDC